MSPSRLRFPAYLSQLFALLSFFFGTWVAQGATLLQISQTVDKTQASIRASEQFTFTINYANSSLSESATTGVLSCVLNSRLEFLSLTQTPHIQSASFNATTSTVTFNFNSPLSAGATGSVSFTCRFKSNTPGNTAVTTTSKVSAANSDLFTSNSSVVTAVSPVVSTTPVYSTSLKMEKTPLWGTETSANQGWLSYTLKHGINHPSGATATNYIVRDDFPANVKFVAFTPESWSSGIASVNVFYKTNQNGSLRAWPGNPRYTTGAPSGDWIGEWELGLQTNEVVTGIEMRYGNLAGGGAFHPDNQVQGLQIYTRIINPAAATVGATISNCANSVANGLSSGNSCTGITVKEARPQFSSWISWGAGAPPYALGQTFKLGTTLAIYDVSTGSIVNPKVGILLPPEFEFLSFDSVDGAAWAAAGSPQPTVEQVSNFEGRAGYKLVRLLWGASNPFTLPVTGQWSSVEVRLNVKVKNSTPNGEYVVEGYVASQTSYQVAAGGSSTCTSDVFQNYNVIVKNNLSSSADIEGRMIAKNYTGSTSTTLAKNLYGWPSADHSLQLQTGMSGGGPLNLQFGSIFIPSVGAANGRQINWNGGGSWKTSGGPDFSAIFSGISTASAAYKLLTPNSTMNIPTSPGPVTLTVGPNLGTLNVAVFSVAGNSLLNNSNVQQIDLNLNGKTPNAIIINCSGSTVTLGPPNFVGNMVNATWRPKIVWNCPDATTVTLNKSLYGSLLAPNASVSATTGAVEGSIYATNLTSSIEVHLPVFTGMFCATTATSSTVTEEAGKYYDWNEVDGRDFDGDGNTTEIIGRTYAGVRVLTQGGQPAITGDMRVLGELDTVQKVAPATGLTTPGGKADYFLKFTNEAGVPLRNLVVINILPHVGDKGVIDLSNRGSTFAPYLAAPISAPNATAFYSTTGNPCRDELTPNIPAGCTLPNWTNVPPADLSTIRSIKLDFGSTIIQPSEVMSISWPMRVSVAAPTGVNDVAWNSFGFSVTRVDTNTKLLPSEPRMTGVKVQEPLPPIYGDRIWLDANKNGVQDSGETGINGIRVELYRDNGDNVRNVSTDTFVKFTTTADGGLYQFANIPSGNYYALVVVPNTYGISPANIGSNDLIDSDGDATQIGGGRTALMPITNLAVGETDRSWDQGLFDRSNTPAVWASVPLATGKVFLGGRFNKVDTTARKNIALVNSNGTVDTTFNPGAGFNNDVVTLTGTSNGGVVAGGIFTQYKGVNVSGLAFLTSTGNVAVTPPMPDTPDVRWVHNAGSHIYVGGRFYKFGGTDRDCIARLNTDGTLDSGFNSANGADDAVNDGAVMLDGTVVVVGKFSTYAGQSFQGVVRLNPNGTVVQGFNVGTGANNEVLAVKVMQDQRLLISGRFTQFNGVACPGNARLESDGRLDASMQSHNMTVNSINDIN
jgi:choice-of-anchor A domain-containing protein